MKDRPTESQMIAYLYGDMASDERREMEEYLRKHPEMEAELEELGSVREMLGKWSDREVAEPALIIPAESSWLKLAGSRWIAVAAAFALLLVAGALTGFNAGYSNGEWTLSFGARSSDGGYTRAEVEEIMQNSLSKFESSLDSKFENFQGRIDNTLASNQEVNEARINDAYDKMMNTSKAQIASYVDQLDKSQKEEISQLFAMGQDQQQVYFNRILNDFSQFIAEERRDDLKDIELYLTKFHEETTEKQLQTDQILASIISQVNAQPISD